MLLTVFLVLMLIVAAVILFVNFSGFLGFLITRVPYARTHKSDVEFIARKLNITSADIFYDLGSGDGRVVFLVEKLSGAKVTGYELTWWTHLLAKAKKLIRKSKAELVSRNFFKQDWSEANFVYAYLFPPLMGRVEQKFLADCKPGSIAIIRDFPFPKLKPVQIYYRPKNHEIYVYRK